MMKKMMILVLAVALVAVIGYFYVTTTSSADNEFDLDIDDDLEVIAKIDLTLNFPDGTSKTITGVNGAPLSVEYDGVAYDSVTWRMKAKATNTGEEPFDELEFNLNPSTAGYTFTDFNLDSIIQYNMGDQQWRQHWAENTEATNQIITLIPDSGSWTTMYEHTIYFDTIFDSGDDPSYSYKVVFDPSGYCIWRGHNDGGYTEWQEASLGSQNMACEYLIDLTGSDATVDWDKQVIWL